MFRSAGRTPSLRWQLLEALPWPAFVLLAVAIFLLFCTVGFLLDIMAGGRNPAPKLAAMVVFSGAIALLYGYGGLRRRIAPIALGVVLQTAFNYVLPPAFASVPGLSGADATARLRLDAAATLAAIMGSYACFLWFINTTAVRYLRVRAEIELAHQIHQVLVPRIAATIGEFEFAGFSIPSGEVGGDLVDVMPLAASATAWFGYVADVSGHGVSSGVVMGMFKSALRMRLRQGGSLSSMLDDLNGVLIPLKSGSMFVTLACIRADERGALEFAVAGHLPVLRVRRGSRIAEEITTPQIPIGMFDDYRFVSSTIDCERGDVLALVTDGLTEVFDGRDRELGLDAVKARFAESADLGVSQIAERIIDAARAHGRQLDDQTLLVIRRR
jgi:hypothetical protein